ncbi:MAG: hypothetical protein EBS55_14285 [Flavobacteriaceae bacterium]|nr:hypothetical protein [Flavobacteriaceae bacterium]
MATKIKTFQEAQTEKISLDPEYPNYWIDMAGKVCYNRDGKFFYCKKLQNGKIKMFINGAECEVNEITIANKYVPDWSKHRRKNKTQGSNDGRYKGNADVVDKGAMSHLKIENPQKPVKIKQTKYIKIERAELNKLLDKARKDFKLEGIDLKLLEAWAKWLDSKNLENG